MKKFLTKVTGLIVLFILFIAFTVPVKAQEGITLSFANAQVTGSGPYFFEFDIMAHATANTQFKEAQIYIDYNTAAFGLSISGTANLTVTKGGLLATVNHSGTGGDIGSYTISTANNSSSRLAIQNSWAKTDLGGGETGFDLTNTLGTGDQVYAHVKIQITDISKTSGISFDESVSQWDLQDYYFTSGDNETNYAPVTESGSLDNPLPVELSSFSAKSQGDEVNLLWKTATEVDNYGFEVERKSVNGGTGSWAKVGFVKGNGNSNSPKSYSFADNNITGGSKFQYRLKQIDNDGKYQFSKVLNIKVIPKTYNLFQNYPNPFNPTTKIRYQLPEESKVVLILYDMLGEEVKELLNEKKGAGTYDVQLNASNLASGIYIYRIVAKGETGKMYISTKKMVLLK